MGTEQIKPATPTEKVGVAGSNDPARSGVVDINALKSLSVTRIFKDFKELILYGSQYDVNITKSELIEAQKRRAWSRVAVIKLSSRMKLSKRKTVFMIPQNYVSFLSHSFIVNMLLQGAKGDYVFIYLAFKPSHIASISLHRVSSTLPVVSLLIRGTLDGNDVVCHCFIGFVNGKRTKWFRIRIRGNISYEKVDQFDPEQFKRLSKFYSIEEVVVQL